MESRFILWLSGTEKMLTKSVPLNTYADTDQLFDDVRLQIMERFYQQGHGCHIEQFRAGFIVDSRERRVAVVTANYTPGEMFEDIQSLHLTNVVFIRPQRSPIKHFVAAGAALNFSFFNQELPKPLHFASSLGANLSDASKAILSKIFRKRKPDIDESNYWKRDLVYGTGGGEATPKKSWKEYFIELVISIVGGVVTNCSFYQALGM